jgi:hypothetical protein
LRSARPAVVVVSSFARLWISFTVPPALGGMVKPTPSNPGFRHTTGTPKRCLATAQLSDEEKSDLVQYFLTL